VGLPEHPYGFVELGELLHQIHHGHREIA